VTYTRDANELAAEASRREERYPERTAARPGPVWGTLTIWPSLRGMHNGDGVIARSLHTHIDLSRPGLLIAYDDQTDAEIFAIVPGWYIRFEPDREGE
jgi:hypothetical protein